MCNKKISNKQQIDVHKHESNNSNGRSDSCLIPKPILTNDPS